MKSIRAEQPHAIIAIATNRGGVQFATTETIARIVILFLCSFALQTVAILLWRGAEFTAFRAQALAADFGAGAGLLVYLAGALVCWLMLRRLPYLGG